MTTLSSGSTTGSAPVCSRFQPTAAYVGRVTTVHVPYTVEQDEDGVWCAHAWLGSSGGAHGNGCTPEEAIADLREAVLMVLDEDGVDGPQRTRTLRVIFDGLRR